MSDPTRPQQDPKPGTTSIFPLVIDDIMKRAAAGEAKYGTFLKADNGRDALVDLYQELLDAVMYTRQMIEEQGIKDNIIRYDSHGYRIPLSGVHEGSFPIDRIVPAEETQKILESYDCLDHGDPMKDYDRLHPSESVTQEAHALVFGNRGKNYGHPLDDFGRTAGFLNVLLGDQLKFPLKPEQVGLMLICVKLSREMNAPKRDNMVDIAGYAETVAQVILERQRRECGEAPRQNP